LRRVTSAQNGVPGKKLARSRVSADCLHPAFYRLHQWPVFVRLVAAANLALSLKTVAKDFVLRRRYLLLCHFPLVTAASGRFPLFYFPRRDGPCTDIAFKPLNEQIS
jgi:hypothetical protein